MLNDFLSDHRAAYEIIWKNTVDSVRPKKTLWRMRVACRIPRDKKTHLEYVILLLFHCNNGYKNAPQSYVIRALSVLFSNLSLKLQVNNDSEFRFTHLGGQTFFWYWTSLNIELQTNDLRSEFDETLDTGETPSYEGWNFNSGNYLFTTDTK